jgi:hypothetical protein
MHNCYFIIFVICHLRVLVIAYFSNIIVVIHCLDAFTIKLFVTFWFGCMLFINLDSYNQLGALVSSIVDIIFTMTNASPCPLLAKHVSFENQKIRLPVHGHLCTNYSSKANSS